MSAIAFASGFASIRRFNAAFRRVYRRPPSALRRSWRSRPGHLR
jgi:AraC family transcriptional regulator of adaptative response / DNA-3-methyladenine glycosylase II